MILKTIEKTSWISQNGKWKIYYHIFEQDGLIQADITVFKLNSRGKYDYFTSNLYDEKLPKYVKGEFEAIRHYVDVFRYPKKVKEQTDEVKEIVEDLMN